MAYLQDDATLILSNVIGKHRVAPIRHMRIPKLELQAAVYGVRLREQILNKDDVRIDKNYHWTGSSTELRWLQAANKKQQVFVANRCRSTAMYQWRHVKGVKNPTDIETRGISIEGFREFVWLNGPTWLQKAEDKWPKPWFQENEVEQEQAISAVATETSYASI